MGQPINPFPIVGGQVQFGPGGQGGAWVPQPNGTFVLQWAPSGNWGSPPPPPPAGSGYQPFIESWVNVPQPMIGGAGTSQGGCCCGGAASGSTGGPSAVPGVGASPPGPSNTFGLSWHFPLWIVFLIVILFLLRDN